MSELENVKSEMLQKIEEVKEEYQILLRTTGEKALKETFENLFRAEPNLEAILWPQYTPYFNDGDACTFGIGEVSVKYKEMPDFKDEVKDHFGDTAGLIYSSSSTDDEDAGESGFYTSYGLFDTIIVPNGVKGYDVKRGISYHNSEPTGIKYDFKYHEDHNTMVNTIRNLLESLEEVLESTFGDHCKVFAYSDGSFEVEEYDHD